MKVSLSHMEHMLQSDQRAFSFDRNVAVIQLCKDVCYDKVVIMQLCLPVCESGQKMSIRDCFVTNVRVVTRRRLRERYCRESEWEGRKVVTCYEP